MARSKKDDGKKADTSVQDPATLRSDAAPVSNAGGGGGFSKAGNRPGGKGNLNQGGRDNASVRGGDSKGAAEKQADKPRTKREPAVSVNKSDSGAEPTVKGVDAHSDHMHDSNANFSGSDPIEKLRLKLARLKSFAATFHARQETKIRSTRYGKRDHMLMLMSRKGRFINQLREQIHSIELRLR